MFNLFNRKKDILMDPFLELGYPEEVINKEALSSKALLDNPHFLKAVAEYRYDLVQKEDFMTADVTISDEERDKYRRYYSELRVLLSGLLTTLDDKIFLVEESGDQETP